MLPSIFVAASATLHTTSLGPSAAFATPPLGAVHSLRQLRLFCSRNTARFHTDQNNHNAVRSRSAARYGLRKGPCRNSRKKIRRTYADPPSAGQRHIHLIQEANTKHNAVQGALQWLEDNQDKSIEDIQAEAAAKATDDAEDDADTKAQIAELEGGATAKSLVCNECGKKFRNPDLASFHASKTLVLQLNMFII